MPPEERSASFTAAGVAILRAVHQLFDGDPRILQDPVILQLLAADVLDNARANLDKVQSAGARALRSHVVLRSRYAEDCLAAAVQRGIRQYVSLGAGFDTFAYRQPAWASVLQIFEVDHAASQRAKIEQLRDAGIAIPPNVQFVAADFASATLLEVLQTSPFRFSEPAFFSCLGVLVYLAEDDVNVIFRFVATLPKSSELVFTFAPGGAGSDSTGVSSALAAGAAAVGEPWRTYHNPASLRRQLREAGFSEISFLSPEEATRLYYQNRADGLPAPHRSSIARAIV
jgi:methyltransferase (TIGR00027 family)